MEAELVFVPEALQDIKEAYEWYEDRRTGLGEEFLSCVEASVEAIRRKPEMYPRIHEDYRRGLVRRFPYAIFNEYAEGKITTYSVFHTARDPHKWRRRVLDSH